MGYPCAGNLAKLLGITDDLEELTFDFDCRLGAGGFLYLVEAELVDSLEGSGGVGWHRLPLY